MLPVKTQLTFKLPHKNNNVSLTHGVWRHPRALNGDNSRTIDPIKMKFSEVIAMYVRLPVTETPFSYATPVTSTMMTQTSW